MNKQKYEIGVVGLGVMGRNLLLNMADHGHSVVGYDKDPARVHALALEGAGRTIRGAGSPDECLSLLAPPRAVIMLVPAGPIVDRVIRDLLPHLKANDILIDCGNSHFTDTDTRQKTLDKLGIRLLGVGVSGGEHGARHGPSIMPGGPLEAYKCVQNLFEEISAHVEEDPCCAYLGPGSAGHFVKMVHNGIEYGLMELIAETYDLMRRGLNFNDSEMAKIYERWNDGSFHSYLIEITAHIFRQTDEKTGKCLIDAIRDEALQKGTGKWTSQAAMDLQVPAPVIDAAVSARDLSVYRQDRETASRLFPVQDGMFRGSKEDFIDGLEKALEAGFLMIYAQGMDLLRKADPYGYDLSLADVARIWRGGCIIRAAILEDIRASYENHPDISNLLLQPRMVETALRCQRSLRDTVCWAANLGIPAPAMMAALAYFDGCRSTRLPANLIQAQRDYFGAHTYERVDQKGIFHTNWEKD
ncbi:MAG: 6-phosphogluconate dehydrogenase [Syntrophus sp. SKADARSKE-3]|nr:6-phosphogluconate dehydrogenase [Syntrophus sp. SKADARSKE-3]